MSEKLYDVYFIFRNKDLSTDLTFTVYTFQNRRFFFKNKREKLFIHYLSSNRRDEKEKHFCGVNMRNTARSVVLILIICVFQNIRHQQVQKLRCHVNLYWFYLAKLTWVNCVFIKNYLRVFFYLKLNKLNIRSKNIWRAPITLLLWPLLISHIIISIIDEFVQKENHVLLPCLSKTKSPYRKEIKGIHIRNRKEKEGNK